jgi:hypothetical protein
MIGVGGGWFGRPVTCPVSFYLVPDRRSFPSTLAMWLRNKLFLNEVGQSFFQFDRTNIFHAEFVHKSRLPNLPRALCAKLFARKKLDVWWLLLRAQWSPDARRMPLDVQTRHFSPNRIQADGKVGGLGGGISEADRCVEEGTQAMRG